MIIILSLHHNKMTKYTTNINNPIRRFFKMHPTRLTQMKFRWWLLHSDRQLEDKDAMWQLWDESPSVCTQETIDELAVLQERINQEKNPALFLRLRRYAASVAILLVAMGTTFMLAREYLSSLHHSDELMQVTVANGRMQTMTLSDSTLVVLNAGTTLVYPLHFNADTRSVFLIGEAYFKVSKVSRQPFIVKTQYLQVTALGTEFGISAYPEQSLISTTLKEGCTRVVVNNSSGTLIGRRYTMRPNQKLTYDKATDKVLLCNLDAKQDLSWRQGNLVFEDASFLQIVDALQRKFGVQIECHGIERLKGGYFVKFRPDEQLAQILHILSNLDGKFTYCIQGKRVVIHVP